MSLHIVSLYGPPGVGKTTQSELLVNRQGFSAVSTGDILKNCTPGFTANNAEGQRHRETYSQRLMPYLSDYTSGGYVPDEVMFPILTEEIMIHFFNGRSRILLPGSIKTRNQAEMFDNFITGLDPEISTSFQFLNYIVPVEVAMNRLVERDKNEQRPDSNIAESRIKAFYSKAFDLTSYYADQDRLLQVDATGTVETVYQLTLRAIGVEGEHIESQINLNDYTETKYE